MVRARGCNCIVWRDIPHTRGDGPNKGKPKQSADKYSPHAWGWSVNRNHNPDQNQIFPTRVGMVRIPDPSEPRHWYIPHTRGDGPVEAFAHQHSDAYSPHAWGWSAVMKSVGKPEMIFPTRVGMVRNASLQTTVNANIPHTRGDGPENGFDENQVRKYSPHAWGWSVTSNQAEIIIEIFPTRVGMVRHVSGLRGDVSDIPHTRGDGPKRSFNIPSLW